MDTYNNEGRSFKASTLLSFDPTYLPLKDRGMYEADDCLPCATGYTTNGFVGQLSCVSNDTNAAPIAPPIEPPINVTKKVCNSNMTSAYCPPSVEPGWSIALRELYDATGGSDWNKKTGGWEDLVSDGDFDEADHDPCEFFGVICDNRGIVAIDLANNGLSSSTGLFGDLELFSHFKSTLRYVDLSINGLQGKLGKGAKG